MKASFCLSVVTNMTILLFWALIAFVAVEITGFGEKPHCYDIYVSFYIFHFSHGQGCQNRDFASGRKEKAKAKIVKLQSESMDSTKIKIMLNICYKM